MRSPLFGLFAALGEALAPRGMALGAPTDHVVVLCDGPSPDRHRDHVAPREHLAPVATVAPEPVEPPPPSVLPRGHVVWCPDCSGRGAEARAACGTCGGRGKVWREIAPVRVAKMTCQLQRAAHRAIASRANTLEALQSRGAWPFSRRTRRSMARGMFRTNFNFYGVQLSAEEVLRAL